MEAAAYLERIGVSGPLEPNLVNLERLQRGHLTAVPFENLDIFYRRGVKTSDAWSIPKIVDRGRGGWCFELNGAFGALLVELGYEVDRLPATVLYPPISPMPTHLTLRVWLDRPYLVDVGFGDSFIRPLPLDAEGPHDGGVGHFGFAFDGDQTTLLGYDVEGNVERHFRFGSSPDRSSVAAADLEEASAWLQNTPGLRWTTTRFATRLLDGGPDRVTLLEDRLKVRRGGQWSEEPVPEDEWPQVLLYWFGMTP